MGVARLGEDEVQVPQRLDGLPQRAGLGSDDVRQLAQDAADFLFFGQLRLAPLVVQLYHRQRLDEQGGAAARLIVHQPGYPALELGAQRNDVAPLALGDDRFLQVGLVRARGHDPLQAFQQAAMRLAQLPADASERIAGAVQHLAALVDAAANLVDDVLWHGDPHGHIGDVRIELGEPAQGAV